METFQQLWFCPVNVTSAEGCSQLQYRVTVIIDVMSTLSDSGYDQCEQLIGSVCRLQYDQYEQLIGSVCRLQYDQCEQFMMNKLCAVVWCVWLVVQLLKSEKDKRDKPIQKACVQLVDGLEQSLTSNGLSLFSLVPGCCHLGLWHIPSYR